MEDFALDIVIGKGPSARSIRLKLPRFTVIGATTRLALVTAPLRARFGAVYRLDFYDLPAMRQIVSRGARVMGVPAEDEGIDEIARRGRGTPRVALRLLRRVRDYAEVRGKWCDLSRCFAGSARFIGCRPARAGRSGPARLACCNRKI